MISHDKVTIKSYAGQHPQCFLRFFENFDTPDTVPSNKEEIRIKRKGLSDVLCYPKHNPMNYEHGWCHTKVANLVAKITSFQISGKLLCVGKRGGKERGKKLGFLRRWMLSKSEHRKHRHSSFQRKHTCSFREAVWTLCKCFTIPNNTGRVKPGVAEFSTMFPSRNLRCW